MNSIQSKHILGKKTQNMSGALTRTMACGYPSKQTVTGITAALITLAHLEQLSGPCQMDLSLGRVLKTISIPGKAQGFTLHNW